MKRKRILTISVIAAMAATGYAPTIDFELGGPALFINANPLSNEYAGVGANFSGPNALDGGAVVNANQGGWTMPALSGSDILGFNDGATMANNGTPTGPERVDFTALAVSVDIWIANASNGGITQVLTAFDAGDNQVDQDFANGGLGVWTNLSVSAPNISYVTFDSGDTAWAVDDLSFSPVPEPATMIALGLGAAALIRRRKK